MLVAVVAARTASADPNNNIGTTLLCLAPIRIPVPMLPILLAIILAITAFPCAPGSGRGDGPPPAWWWRD